MTKKLCGFRLSSASLSVLEDFEKLGQNRTETIEKALMLFQAVELSKNFAFKQSEQGVIQKNRGVVVSEA
jgi:hypothetical protein